MKNVIMIILLIVMIILLSCALIFLGCAPEEWDINKNANWKLTSNKGKTSGGSSIYDVAEWQELNLE